MSPRPVDFITTQSWTGLWCKLIGDAGIVLMLNPGHWCFGFEVFGRPGGAIYFGPVMLGLALASPAPRLPPSGDDG